MAAGVLIGQSNYCSLVPCFAGNLTTSPFITIIFLTAGPETGLTRKQIRCLKEAVLSPWQVCRSPSILYVELLYAVVVFKGNLY